ncbi:hypothetical protein K474DRAFT_1713494 [Panus rudis PR-1116 ss-1]|nr:hypothetical protein K474DRAFT_1713494 [Panus rudis PR-1116 ss-1]
MPILLNYDKPRLPVKYVVVGPERGKQTDVRCMHCNEINARHDIRRHTDKHYPFGRWNACAFVGCKYMTRQRRNCITHEIAGCPMRNNSRQNIITAEDFMARLGPALRRQEKKRPKRAKREGSHVEGDEVRVHSAREDMDMKIRIERPRSRPHKSIDIADGRQFERKPIITTHLVPSEPGYRRATSVSSCTSSGSARSGWSSHAIEDSELQCCDSLLKLRSGNSVDWDTRAVW